MADFFHSSSMSRRTQISEKVMMKGSALYKKCMIFVTGTDTKPICCDEVCDDHDGCGILK